MVKVSRPSAKGGAAAISKGTRSIQPKTQVPRGTPAGSRVKVPKIGPKQKNIAQKTNMAVLNKQTSNKRFSNYKGNLSKADKERKITGRQTEKKVAKYYRKRGYETYPLQYNRSGHGVDLGIIKRASKGRVREGGIVEVKGSKVRTPSVSHFKNQVRRSYYLDRLGKARKNGIKGADELYTLAKDKSQKLQSIAITSGPQGNRLYKIPPTGKISKKYQSITL
jgi:hypothetical protein